MLDVAPWDSHSQELEHARPQAFRLVPYLCTDLAERVGDEEGEMIGRRTLDLCARQANTW